MFGPGELLCAELKRSLISMLPWDVPWYDPSHTVFFLALYGALAVIGLGLLAAALMTVKSLLSGKEEAHH